LAKRNWILATLALLFIVFLSAIKPILAIFIAVLFVLTVIISIKRYDFSVEFILFTLLLITSFNQSDRIGVLIVGSLILLYLFNFLTNKKYRNKINTSRLFLFFVLWLFYATVQMLLVDQYIQNWSHFQTLVFGVGIIWIMTRLINSKDRIETFYKAWGFAVFLSILFGWWEVITDNHLKTSSAYSYDLNNITTVGFFNPNDYSFLLILSLPIMLFWVTKGKLLKLLGLFMIASSFYFTFMNGSRFILLVFILVIGLFTIKLAKSKKKGTFISFVLVLVGSVIYFKDIIFNAITDVSTLSGGDSSTEVRKYLSNSAWDIFKKYPFGVGSGNLENYMPVVGYKVHNFWFEILVNYGLVIFIGLLLFLVVGIYKMRCKRNREMKNIVWPILWSTIIFIPTCIQSSSIFQFNILLGFHLCL